jgi:hypothetical protein
MGDHDLIPISDEQAKFLTEFISAIRAAGS